MLVQPQQAATVCEFDSVPHTIGSLERAQTLDPNPQPGSSHEPLDPTLDLEYAHVSGRSRSPLQVFADVMQWVLWQEPVFPGGHDGRRVGAGPVCADPVG